MKEQFEIINQFDQEMKPSAADALQSVESEEARLWSSLSDKAGELKSSDEAGAKE